MHKKAFVSLLALFLIALVGLPYASIFAEAYGYGEEESTDTPGGICFNYGGTFCTFVSEEQNVLEVWGLCVEDVCQELVRVPAEDIEDGATIYDEDGLTIVVFENEDGFQLNFYLFGTLFNDEVFFTLE